MHSNNIQSQALRTFDSKPERCPLKMLLLKVTCTRFMMAIQIIPILCNYSFPFPLFFSHVSKETKPWRLSEKHAGDAVDSFSFSFSTTRPAMFSYPGNLCPQLSSVDIIPAIISHAGCHWLFHVIICSMGSCQFAASPSPDKQLHEAAPCWQPVPMLVW